MSIDPTGLGSAGLLIFLVVKEAFAFANKRRNGKPSGQMDASEWKLIITALIRDEVKPVLEGRERIFNELEKIKTLLYERREQ